jgi:hypothetical protein
VRAATPAQAADRVARALAAQDAAGAPRAVSHLTLELDGNAGVERIRLELRGAQLDAALATRDTASAERLAERVGELRDALAGRGLVAESVRIAPSAPAPRPDDARPDHPRPEAGRERHSDDPGRERSRRDADAPPRDGRPRGRQARG